MELEKPIEEKENLIFTEDFLPNTLLTESPFFFMGMTSKEYEAEEERYGQFLADGGRPFEYNPLNKKKNEE